MLQRIKEEGYDLALLAVYVKNEGAIRWNYKSGSRYWGRITYLNFFGRPFWFKQVKIKNLSSVFDHAVSKVEKNSAEEPGCQVSPAMRAGKGSF